MHATGSVTRLDEVEPAYTLRDDLLPDGSILCWHYADWNDINREYLRYASDGSKTTELLDGYLLLK